MRVIKKDMNVGKKIITYTKALGLSALLGLSSCAKESAVKMEEVVEQTASKTTKLLSMLECGDTHAIKLANVPKGQRVLTVDEISQYAPTDSVGELFYQVYVGKADRAIRSTTGKEGDLVTVGQGITGLNRISLAGNRYAYEGDYVCAQSADSLLNLEINKRKDIITNAIGDSISQQLPQHEKDAIIAYLYNVNPRILTNAHNGKSFFEYLAEGNKGMVQSKFNIKPSSECAATGLAKRNLIQLLIFGDGKVYPNEEAQKNFREQVNIIKQHKKGNEFLREALNIVKEYGVNQENITQTENIIFPK